MATLTVNTGDTNTIMSGLSMEDYEGVVKALTNKRKTIITLKTKDKDVTIIKSKIVYVSIERDQVNG